MKRLLLFVSAFLCAVSAKADLHNPGNVLQTLMVSTITISCSSCGIVGVTDGSTANASIVGEYISSATSGTSFPGTTGQWGNVVSITLTAGDWDLSGLCDHQANGGTVTRSVCCVGGTITGNNGTGCATNSNQGDTGLPTSVDDGSIGISGVRESIITTTTFYLKHLLAFSVATPLVNGRITARRVR